MTTRGARGGGRPRTLSTAVLMLATAGCGGALADAYAIVDDMTLEYDEIRGVVEKEADEYRARLEEELDRCPEAYPRATEPPPIDNRLYNLSEWSSEIRAYNATRRACLSNSNSLHDIVNWFAETNTMLSELLDTGMDQIREDLANGDRARTGRIIERAISMDDAFVRMARVNAPLERRRELPTPASIIRERENRRSQFEEAAGYIRGQIERLAELTESLDSRY